MSDSTRNEFDACLAALSAAVMSTPLLMQSSSFMLKLVGGLEVMKGHSLFMPPVSSKSADASSIVNNEKLNRSEFAHLTPFK
jgi:hypothetical protein